MKEYVFDYIKMGFKAIRLRGYNRKYNEQHDYKKAKQAIERAYTNPAFKGLSLQEIEKAEEQDYWSGWLVANGYLVIDSENHFVLKMLDKIARETNCSVQKTNRGKQYMFRYDQKNIPASSEYFCAGGFPVTPRVAGKNYVIMPPTNGRTWEHWSPPEKLPQLPEMLLPCDPKNKQQIALCLAWNVGETYRQGILAGWEDIDAAFMAYLFECGFSVELIHQCFYFVFMDDYDTRRTEEVYNRAKNLKENGNKILGAGSFVKKINDLKLDKIKRFLNPLGSSHGESRAEADNVSASPNDMPEPIPFDDDNDLPEFPIDAIPDNICRDMVIETSNIMQIDPGFTATMLLGSLSACAQGKLKVDLITHFEHSNLYLVSCAFSSF